jgi:RNA polymerase sigma factor (TIGR02999 family)
VDRGSEATADLTGLLQAWDRGDTGALEELAPLLQAELRGLARGILSRERAANGWQATELVHEAYLRLLGWRNGVRWQNRAHFFSTTAAMMRRVLVDAARTRGAAKRDAGAVPVSLDAIDVAAPQAPLDVVAVADALTALAAVVPRASQVVELRFFGGFSVEETAEALGISPRTVNADWNTARAWLSRELTKGALIRARMDGDANGQ